MATTGLEIIGLVNIIEIEREGEIAKGKLKTSVGKKFAFETGIDIDRTCHWIIGCLEEENKIIITDIYKEGEWIYAK